MMDKLPGVQELKEQLKVKLFERIFIVYYGKKMAHSDVANVTDLNQVIITCT